MKKFLVLATLLVATHGVVNAGDAAAGKAKAAACGACHSVDGNSVNPIWPKLAGQNEGYLVKQLQEFKKGMETSGKFGRFEASMSAMAAPLSNEDIADVAAYFASQSVQYSGVKPEFAAIGSKLYRGGDMSRGVPACTACHGPNGKGMASAKFPALGGQHVDYTIAQLKAFRDGKRANDPNGMMRGAAKNLTDAQIEALAHYMVGLH